MSSHLKNEVSVSDFEVEPEDSRVQAKLSLVRVIDTLRVGFTIVALAVGAVVLGLSADALAVYNATSLPADFMISLWPDEFDTRPTKALIACGAVVVVANALALALSKVAAIRSRALANSSVSLAAPLAGLIGAIAAMVIFYSVNSSSTVDTIQSWSCHWSGVRMETRPYFGTLCKQTKASLTLATLLVPLEALVIGVAGCEAIFLRQASRVAYSRRV